MEKFFHILLTLLLLGLYSAPAFSVCHIEVTAGTAISNLFTTPRQGEGRVYEDGPVTVSMFDCEDAEPGWTWVWQKHDMANYYTAIQLGGSSVTISSSDPMFSSREMYGIHLTQWPIALAEKCKVGERCKLPLVADGRKLNDTNEVAVAFGKKPVAPSSLVVESCQHSEVDHMYNIHFSVSGGGDNDPGTGLGIGFIASENALYNGPFVERDENGNGEGDILVSDNVNTLF